MADEDTQEIKTVSQEAHSRMTKERDEARARLAELEATVLDVGYMESARKFFKSKQAPDPDWAAEMALPHIRTIPKEKLESVLASERFNPLWQQAAPTVGEEDEGAPDKRLPSVAQPSPAAEGAVRAELPKFNSQSPEYQSALRRNDREWFDKNKDRIEWRVPEAPQPVGLRR